VTLAKQTTIADHQRSDMYLRKMLVQGAHCILSKRGPDTDLKRWGLRLSDRGGKNAKKRASVAWLENWGFCCTGYG